MVTCQAQDCTARPTNPGRVTLYLTEEQVSALAELKTELEETA